jgi:peptidoglycan hydrolase-like protein with peptidoglycan-binding domain
VSTWQGAHGVASTGVVDAATWRTLLIAPAAVVAAPKPAAHPELTRYRNLVLRRGSKGPAVVALQHRLAMPHTPGTFGMRTRTRVLALQRAHGLPATGVVAARTWAALGA